MDDATPRPVARLAISQKENILVLLGIAGLFMFLFGSTLQAHFYVIEDYILINERTWNVSDWVVRVTSDVHNFARIRPAYWLYQAIGGIAFGANPHLWHAATILWGMLTCYLLYSALRKIGAGIASSVIFVLLLVLGGKQNWIWINLIPQETIGMLLTALAVWAIALASQRSHPSRWDVVAIIAMTFAGLVKESFVILIPALLMLRLTCQRCFNGQSWRESLGRLRVPLGAGALVFLLEIMVVMAVFLSKPGGYSAKASGLSVSSFDPSRWLQIVLSLRWEMQLMSGAGVLLWVSLWFDKTFSRSSLLASAAILAAWLVPQVVLYTNGLHERYLFPAIVGVAAALALELSILRRKRLWPLWLAGVLLLLPTLANGIKSTTATVGWFTAETLAANSMVEFLAQNIPANQIILMAGDAGTPYGYEATYALPLYLKAAGSQSSFYLWPLVSKGERSALHIAASKENTAFRYPETLRPRDVGAIMIVGTYFYSFDTKPLVDWLGDSVWREITFTEPFSSFSIAEFKYVKTGEVSNRVLLPATSDVPSSRPLIIIDPALVGIVHANPLLEVPPWPLEKNPTGPGSMVWLGHGDAQGIGGTLSSTKRQAVDIVLDLVPGPGRIESRRTLEFSLGNRAEQTTQREVSDGGQLTFTTTLQPGANQFRLRVLEKALVTVQPNGDTRPLLALLRSMIISASPEHSR